MKLKHHRFKKNEISEFLSNSTKHHTPFFTIFFKQNQQHPQFAFIAPKRVGNAVQRNSIRRQFKSVFLKILTQNLKNTSIIIIAKNKMTQSNFNITYNMVLLSLKKKERINENNLHKSN